jgi:O-acetyl-ADP-ribose deacetylase (regulator of RNase III)
MDNASIRELLKGLVAGLCAERGFELLRTEDVDELWTAFRALVNTRPPISASDEWLAMQDELLQGMIAEAGVSSVDDAAPSTYDPRLHLWRGDITTLAVDAIVNAANSQMLGCWVPGHHCIDNAIHTFAGVQLRIACARIMEVQGHEEPTGMAKITPAYNLPSKHVIHTVGPIANGEPTDLHRKQLASCYRSCLDLAAENGLASIAFLLHQHGRLRVPTEEGCGTRVNTVRKWLNGNDLDMTVVFNVFVGEDEHIYRELLGI